MASPAINSPIDPAKQKRYPVTVSENLLGALGKGRSQNVIVQCRFSKRGPNVYNQDSS